MKRKLLIKAQSHKIRIAIILLALLPTFYSVVAQPHIPFKDSLIKDTTIVSKLCSVNFYILKSVKELTPMVLSNLIQRNNSNCISNPNEKFNSSDLRDTSLCDLRLSFAGHNKKSRVEFIVYQKGTIGGTETNCIIYLLSKNKPVSYVIIGISNDIKTLARLKHVLKTKGYYIV